MEARGDEDGEKEAAAAGAQELAGRVPQLEAPHIQPSSPHGRRSRRGSGGERGDRAGSPAGAGPISWSGPLSPSWRGVSLHPAAAPAPSPATPFVAELLLRDLNLTGVLPMAPLALLRRLRTLDLSSNAMSGELPYSLPRSLLALDLSRNALSGAVPTCLLLF